MRTSVRRCPARYPYVAPAPRAAAVSPCGGSSSAPLLPIKKPTSRTSFKYQNPESNNKPPHTRRISPVRTGARLFDYFKAVSHSVVGGWVFSSNTLTSGVHSTMRVSFFSFFSPPLFFFCSCCYLSDALIHYPAEVHPAGSRSGCVFVCAHSPANRFR